MFKTPRETRDFFNQWKVKVPDIKDEVVFFPSAFCIEAASESLRATSYKWGAQNTYFQLQGAFTGENSAAAVKDLGGHYILIGHSERRKIFKESDEWIAEKVSFVQSLGLTPMLCIGETLQERESGQTRQINEQQLKMGLAKAHAAKPLVVAYEPVWAIGTGKVASPEQVAETHSEIKKILSSLGFKSVPLLYGGSVKPDNSKSLLSIPDVDGFLVGGASLEVDSFLAIVNSNR